MEANTEASCDTGARGWEGFSQAGLHKVLGDSGPYSGCEEKSPEDQEQSVMASDVHFKEQIWLLGFWKDAKKLARKCLWSSSYKKVMPGLEQSYSGVTPCTTGQLHSVL